MGMGKRNQPGKRSGRGMARVEKALNSPHSDGHLFRRKQLAQDSVKQEEFINRIRANSGLPPIKRRQASEDRTSVEFHEGDLLGIEFGDLILAQRIYSRNENGGLVGDYKSEAECVAVHSRVRRERAVYRELDGRMVTAGDVVGIRKGKYMKPRKDDKRRAPGVLRSIMVRLMPHEGEIAGEFITPEGLAKAMDRTVGQFANALGCDVVSAVVHRMSGWDCHIHLQYTMIQAFEETPSMLGRRLKPWREKASAMARAALKAEEVESPAPRSVGDKIKTLVESGELEPKPVAGIEYRKTPGKRSLLENAIMGYSFRHKLNLLRVAEEARDMELAEKVIRMRDGPGRFRPFAERDDSELEERYLDLWLERVWRSSIREELPEVALAKLLPAGVASVTDYVTYGTVLVEETHLDRRKAELEQKAEDLESLRLAAERTVAEAKGQADEAVTAAKKEVVDARMNAAALLRKAANARRAASAELERVRAAGSARIREGGAENDELRSRNKHLVNFAAKCIDVFMMLLEFPGFKQLLGVMPQKLRDSVESLRIDLEKEIAGVGYTSSSPVHAVEPEVKPEPDAPVILPDSGPSQ